MVIPNPQVIGVQGQSLVLQCITSGFPQPMITWYFNMRQISVNDAPRLSITPDGNLIINGVVTDDDGLYQCVATNAAGSDDGTVNLTIHGKNSCSIFSINSLQLFALEKHCSIFNLHIQFLGIW